MAGLKPLRVAASTSAALAARMVPDRARIAAAMALSAFVRCSAGANRKTSAPALADAAMLVIRDWRF